MIINNTREFDPEDAAVLFLAMAQFAGSDANTSDTTLVSVGGHAVCMDRAALAAGMLAALNRQHPDDWDGVMWFEWMEDATSYSLAAQLFLLGDDTEVESVVIGWLERLSV